MRSITLPTAPPNTSASAKQNSFCVGWLRNSHKMKNVATMPMPVKNQRCQPDAVDNIENAAPLLCTRTRLKNEVTVWLSPS